MQFFVRFRCPGFGAILVTCGMVRWPPVEVKVEDALALKFTNFERRLDLCAGNNCVQVSYETLSTAACFDKTYLPLSNSTPLTWRVWSCSSSYNFVTKSGNFWITQLVSRLITLLYDSLQLLYHRRGKQGCRDHF